MLSSGLTSGFKMPLPSDSRLLERDSFVVDPWFSCENSPVCGRLSGELLGIAKVLQCSECMV